ncbi:At2g23090 like protein [Lactarius tabidus]
MWSNQPPTIWDRKFGIANISDLSGRSWIFCPFSGFTRTIHFLRFFLSIRYLGMGNGAKAQQKRERNADKNGPKGAKSQFKSNEAAKSIICAICRQDFLVTTRTPALEEHSQNKHSKSMAECFPDVAK